MNITIKNELDPVFETIGLLYFSNLPDWKEELMKELPTYGFEAETFYNKHYKIVEKYLKVFQKHKISCPEETLLFGDNSRHIFILLTAIATEYRAHLNDQTVPDASKLRNYIACTLSENEETPFLTPSSGVPELREEKDILDFLDVMKDLTGQEKWTLLQILRKPEEWFLSLKNVINKNLPAFEKSRTAVEKPLEKLLLKNTCKEDEEFLKLAHLFSARMTVYTSLILPFTQVVMDSCGYYGILCCHLRTNQKDADTSYELLIRQLKALSDKSKMDILRELRTSRMYNLEMSEKLHLSPSTMSHHMNALLICGFVAVEKQDGKVYYCVNKENIETFLNQLKTLLL